MVIIYSPFLLRDILKEKKDGLIIVLKKSVMVKINPHMAAILSIITPIKLNYWRLRINGTHKILGKNYKCARTTNSR